MDAFEGQETSSGVRLTETGVLAIPAVMACIRVLSESIASLPLLVYEKQPNGNRDRATDFSLYDILHRNPNSIMSSFELRELMMAHLCLRGNAYCYIQRYHGETTALWPFNPSRMRVENKRQGLVYTYQGDEAEVKYRADDILHIRGLSSDGIIGYSPLSLFKDAWGASKAVSDYGANFFKNGAAPGGILSHPGKLDQAAHDNLKAAWGKGFQGSGKAHKTAVLEGGMTWESVGISPQDGQMLESQKFSVIEICRIYRVPPSLLQDHDRSTYSNVVEMSRSFLVHTLRPYLSRFEQAIEKTLLTEQEKQRYSVEHLTTDMLRGDTKARFEAYEIARRTGFMSTNEIRKAESLNNIGPEGDVFESLTANLPQPKDDNRAVKKKPTPIEERDAITAAHYPKIKAAIANMVKWEVKELRTLLQSRAPFDDAWGKFFEGLPGEVSEKIGPAFREFQSEMAELLKTDLKAPNSDVEAIQEKSISDYALSHSLSTRGQLEALFEEGSLEDVEQHLNEWEADDHRAEKESQDQSVKVAEGLFVGMAFAGGYKVMSNTRGGDSCPFCIQLNGKVISRGESMLKAGPWTATDGKVMDVRRDHISPSYHRGCKCFLTYL